MSQNIFKTICKKCGGKCCKSYYIFLTKKELARLLKLGVKFKYKKTGAGYIMDSTRGCVFLDKKTGCALTGRHKPVDCKLFPLAFINKKEKTNFYLIKDCIYHKKVSREFLGKLKARIKRRLKKWTAGEKNAYSELIEAYPKKDLLKF